MSSVPGSKRVMDLPPTPDFDVYEITARIKSSEPVQDGRVLRLNWSDGHVSKLHAIWLRDNASDTANLNLETREARTDVTAVPPDIRITSAEVDDAGALVIAWSEGEAVSRFHPGWLRHHDYTSDHRTEDPAEIESILWDAGSMQEPPTFDGSDILENDETLGDWLRAIVVYGIARLSNVTIEEGMVARVTERVGPVRTTNFGRIFDVKVKSGPGSNAFTALPLTPHTDLPTREYQPGLQFLHCLEASSEDGHARYVDGYKLCEEIRARDPLAFECLTTTLWPTSNRALDTDYRWRAPVIHLDRSGRIDEVRATPFLRAPLDIPFDQVEEAYRALRLFFEIATDDKQQMKFAYKRGDLVGMDNRRVLHGRDAYDPSKEKRWLQGCYSEREELISRLRILQRNKRRRQNPV